MNQNSWMVQRVLIAVCFLVGLYIFFIGVAVGFRWIPYSEWTYAGSIHISRCHVRRRRVRNSVGSRAARRCTDRVVYRSQWPLAGRLPRARERVLVRRHEWWGRSLCPS